MSLRNEQTATKAFSRSSPPNELENSVFKALPDKEYCTRFQHSSIGAAENLDWQNPH